jgi:predicted Zn-dependent protease
VYVPGGATYKNMVANAFNKWSSASGGKINWTMTNSPSGADYTFSWTNSQREVAAGTEAGLTTTDTVSNGYGETIERAHTSVLTRYNGRPLSNAAIAETVLHEIGHGLGLEGHSSNPRDIMYYAATSGQGGLTARDMNTISKLYR